MKESQSTKLLEFCKRHHRNSMDICDKAYEQEMSGEIEDALSLYQLALEEEKVAIILSENQKSRDILKKSAKHIANDCIRLRRKIKEGRE